MKDCPTATEDEKTTLLKQLRDRRSAGGRILDTRNSNYDVLHDGIIKLDPDIPDLVEQVEGLQIVNAPVEQREAIPTVLKLVHSGAGVKHIKTQDCRWWEHVRLLLPILPPESQAKGIF